MYNNQKERSNGAVLVILILINAVILKEGFTSSPGLYEILWFTVPVMIIAGLWNRRLAKEATRQKK